MFDEVSTSARPKVRANVGLNRAESDSKVRCITSLNVGTCGSSRKIHYSLETLAEDTL